MNLLYMCSHAEWLVWRGEATEMCFAGCNTSQYFIRNYSSAIVHCSGVLAPVVCA